MMLRGRVAPRRRFRAFQARGGSEDRSRPLLAKQAARALRSLCSSVELA